MSKTTDFHVRLPEAVSNRVGLVAREQGVSRNTVVISALEEFLDVGGPGAGKGKEDLVQALRGDVFEVKRRVSALREDVEILGELLSFFIYHWIGYTPRLEKEERLSLAAEAKERHDRFLTLFAKKLALGELSLATVISRSEEFRKRPVSPGQVAGEEKERD